METTKRVHNRRALRDLGELREGEIARFARDV